MEIDGQATYQRLRENYFFFDNANLKDSALLLFRPTISQWPNYICFIY